VKLAAQVFNTSVSDALKYLSEDLNLKEFENAAYTAEFCLQINNIFGVMNTRNTFIFKKSQGLHNFNFIQNSFNQLRSYNG
jgi:hypothetical protein